jgi:hypothetical protein
MRFSRLLAFVCALAPSAVFAQITGSVTGHVSCSDTHTPCRFATVQLQTVQSVTHSTKSHAFDQKARNSYAAATGLDGSYEIDGVAPGDYYVLPRLPGYLDPFDQVLSELGNSESPTQDALDKILTRITVAPNRPVSADLTLVRGSSLSGVVRFDDGGAAINVAIELFLKDASGKWKKYSNRSGDEGFSAIGFASHTDDRGHFYEPSLPSGTYAVEIRLQEIALLPSSILGGNSVDTADTHGNALRVYDGDKFRLKDATPIKLGEGEDRTDIDITIPTAGLHSIRGSVSAKNGDTVDRGMVELADPDDKTILRTTSIQPDGTFSFNNLPSGTYTITMYPANHETSFQKFTSTLVVENDLLGLTYNVSPQTRSSRGNQ